MSTSERTGRLWLDRRAAAALAVSALAMAGAGCTASLPKTVGSAPVLSVATALWPFAEAAQVIGGAKVAVVDVVPAGTNPLTLQPDSATARILQSAGLVVEAGRGFQPGVAKAATGAPHVAAVANQIGATDPYVWLDPSTMEKAVTAIAAAMSGANPAAGALYRRNAEGLNAQIESVQIDYSSTLSTCPGNTLLTADGAFTAMAQDFSLTDLVTGPAPAPALISSDRARLDSGTLAAALNETWVDDRGLSEVATAAGIKIHAIDTLAGVPTGAGAVTTGPNAYPQMMERDLGSLSGALGCNNNEQ